ncbi:MAG TPA: MmoB/DmpM family protein [Polyangiaceae bacterium]|jgi:toluene monooxygenase system protein D|nr:MmoB/DmpM family protein [Polyangiaceae bacterium]
MEDAVGPILRMCEEVELVVAAIREDNPEAELEIIDSGAYVRVQARGSLRITRATLQRNLGAAFQMRQLSAILTAFAGKITTTSDEMSWTLTPNTKTPKNGHDQ